MATEPAPEAEAGTKTATKLKLDPPDALQPVPPAEAAGLVPLKTEETTELDKRVAQFVDELANLDSNSPEFGKKVDQLTAMGRKEIAEAAGASNRFLDRPVKAIDKDTGIGADLTELRRTVEALDPKEASKPRKLLGLIPFGNKLEAYFRKFESAASQLQTSMTQLYAAKDGIQKDVIDIEATRTKLWEAMQSLAAAARFARTLDGRLAERVDQLKATDPLKAKALEQEVLFYARQNLADIQTQQAVCVNGYLALDVLKKTGREMMIGCDRVATTGMSALAVAQTVARATGNQIEVMDMLEGVNSTIGKLIAQTGEQLNQHVQRTTEFAKNPMIGVEQIKQMFDQTYRAMDAMDNFRSDAIVVMGRNNEIMQSELERSRTYLDRVRQDQAGQALKGS